MNDLLLIEDDAAFAELLAVILDAKAVRIAATMEEAERMIAARPPDFVLLDLRLPDSQPMQTLGRIHELKAKTRGAKVVIITGDDQAAFRETAMEVGADDYLAKNSGPGFFAALTGYAHPKCSPCASEDEVMQIERTVADIVGLRSPRPPLLTIRFGSEIGSTEALLRR